MTIERLPATGRRQDYGKHIILGYAGEDLRFNVARFQDIARQIEMKVFGIERKYAAEDVAHNFREGGSMTIVARTDTEELVGYSSQRLLVPTLDGSRRRVLFTTTRAIVAGSQGEGIGPETLRFSFNMHGAPDIVAGIMGWAPPVVAYYNSGVVDELEGEERVEAKARIEPSGDDELDQINRQLAVVKLHPFFRSYKESPLMGEALEYVLQQSRYRGHPFYIASGLMKGLWDKDSTMLFRAEKASRRVEVVGKLLKDTFDCDPTNGDAIVVMGPKKGWKSFLV